jgi:alkylhydroperoxidase family enzyme
MKRSFILSAMILVASPFALQAQEPSATPKVVPATRPEMKIALEALKERTPRLPLAPPSEGSGGVNNGRMRGQYIPQAWGGGGRNRPQAGQTAGEARPRQGNNGTSTFDSVFTTSMFWVVSRANNCHYCLGHQELKLKNDGVEDDKIAALDSDWSGYDPRMQAALAYTRKLTLEPQLIGDADIAALKKQFSDAEIIALTLTIGRFNATNRWTDGTGIPQDKAFSNRDAELLTPTSEKFRITTSIVTPNTRAARRPLPTVAEFETGVAAAGARQPRVALPSEADARAALADAIGDRAPLMWERVFTADGNASQVKSRNTMMTDDNLPPRLKAELALVCAVSNRAWYSAAHAARQLSELGATPEEVSSLITGSARRTPAGPAAARALAVKSTTNPHLISDADIANVRKHYSDAETAMILHVVCQSNMFDRVTEALGLPIEQSVTVKTSSTP